MDKHNFFYTISFVQILLTTCIPKSTDYRKSVETAVCFSYNDIINNDKEGAKCR